MKGLTKKAAYIYTLAIVIGFCVSGCGSIKTPKNYTTARQIAIVKQNEYDVGHNAVITNAGIGVKQRAKEGTDYYYNIFETTIDGEKWYGLAKSEEKHSYERNYIVRIAKGLTSQYVIQTPDIVYFYKPNEERTQFLNMRNKPQKLDENAVNVLAAFIGN
ncbi:MAG: hypothetical protein LBG79_08850 [Spirochaetaceae bacterium]|jgi:hypothetical protein|nr:hypothetical protein [Spirochaetaceae bacterium]GMO17346.1 MAG: hypothetical protein Pg6A_03720 [Termitinemataceae bacterium]